MVNEEKLNQFIGQMLGDLGGAMSVALVRMGDALGLYRILHDKGAMTSRELADAASVDERYLREWLSHQAASNYLSYDPASGRFALPPEQAMVFAVEDSPVYMMGAFDAVAAQMENQDKVQRAFKAGGGVAWGDQAACLFCATARFFKFSIPYLKHGLDASIIVIASRNVPAPGVGAAAYSVSKAGVTQLARVAALELAPYGVRVNILHPDAVFDTQVWTEEALKKSADRYGMTVEAYKKKNLLRTELTSAGVAAMVSTVAGPVFGSTTGAQIPIDGGSERVV